MASKSVEPRAHASVPSDPVLNPPSTSLPPLTRQRKREPPASGPPLVTYQRILRAAGELLGEVGFDKLTTNDICDRANITPPALYHYFHDKYDILEELAQRLLQRQNEAFFVWLFNGGAWANLKDRRKALEEWYRIAVEVTQGEPGAMWTLRALRALPHLAHIRLASQRMLTDQLFEIYHRLYPDVEPQLLWCRLRISCELGFMVEELAMEEDRIPNDVLFREAARIVGGPFRYDDGAA